MLTDLLYGYLGGLIALTTFAVAWSKEASVWDIELRSTLCVFLILSWPLSLPVTFTGSRLNQI